MLKPIQKNSTILIVRRILLPVVSMFLFLLVHAQEDDRRPVLGTDTIKSSEIVVDDAPPDEVEKTDSGKKYFYIKSDTLSIVQRVLPVDVEKRFRDDKDFWYANADIKNSKSKEKILQEKEEGRKSKKGKNEQAIEQARERNDSYVPVGQRPWFQTLLWIIIIAGFAGVLYMYLSGSNVGLFRKKNVKTTSVEEEEAITEDIFAINYQAEIDKAAAKGNHRLAIRLMFLRVLKTMAEKNIIRYKQDKTNLDYLIELQSTDSYASFFRITRIYEYSWYGKFPVSESDFETIRKDFEQFDKTLR